VQPQNKSFTAGGIRHYYLDWGNESKPPLLLLHATGLCAQAWQPIALGLAPDFHVMAFDQRGHGDTGPVGGDYTFPQLGKDLADLIQECGWPHPIVVGHSAGGFAALIAASLLPGRIQQAVILETRVAGRPPSLPADELRKRAARTRMKRTIWDSREAMYEAYRSRPVFKSWRDDVFRAFIEGGTRPLDDGRVALKCPPEVEATFYENRDLLDPSAYFQGLQGRFLLLLGNYPGAQSLQDAGIQKFMAQVPGARVKQLPVGSHFVPLEHPDLVLQEIREFLEV